MAQTFMNWLASIFAPTPRYTITYAQTPYGFMMPTASARVERTSDDGVRFLKDEEGFRPKAYWDVKQWAIGYGHKIIPGDGLTRNSVITDEQATQILRRDLLEREATLRRLVKVPVNQRQFDALISLLYNLGAGNFAKSDLLRYLNAGNYAAAKQAFALYSKAGGSAILQGRRAREAALFAA